MICVDYLKLWVFLIYIDQILGLPFNQPKFCPNVSWNSNATTATQESAGVVRAFSDIFITTNNTIYVPNRRSMNIIAWSTTNLTRTINISLTSNTTHSVFVTEENAIYFDYIWNSSMGIRKVRSNLSIDLPVMEVCSGCYDIFLDIYSNAYCSAASNHQVLRKFLNNALEPIEIVAGIGIAGSTSYTLNKPRGIFVESNRDLYVADFANHRIQLFRSGQSNGITVAGNESSPVTITLYLPNAIVLDANKYLFVVDSANHRIVGSGPYGFRCLVGCSQVNGSAVDQLSSPRSMSFDTFGNMFVVDGGNNRIQKFLLLTNSCNEAAPSSTNNVTYLSNNTLHISAVNKTNGVSYNRPKFLPYAVWNPSATTWADNSIVGTTPYDIFINTNNTIYVIDRTTARIGVYANGSIDSFKAVPTSILNPRCIFITTNDDIFVDDPNSSFTVNQLRLDQSDSAVVMYVGHLCFGLFVDINNSLYCSLYDQHQVVRKSLNTDANVLAIVAGTSCSGSTSNTLDLPHGIFVDLNFDLYVADFSNNRIQLFRAGELNATTIAGSGSFNVTITLNQPTDVTLDADKYLFIVDYGNHRIVGAGPNGFRCVVGCTGLLGNGPDRLQAPTSMAFDRQGNIYVADQNNDRIQKFMLLDHTLLASYNQPTFCENAAWNSDGMTFFSRSGIGGRLNTLFIDTNNRVYVVDKTSGEIFVWLNDSSSPSVRLSSNVSSPNSIFVSKNGDIYVDDTSQNGRIGIFTLNANSPIRSVPISGTCYGLFIDTSNSLYCADNTTNQVLKTWLGDNTTTFTSIAGTGSAGSALNMLNWPNGIFVEMNFDLYVADTNNHRIQLFRLGERNGITVAGNVSTIILLYPTSVILDANKYLFVADSANGRIIKSTDNGFRCIAGCNASSSSAASKLNSPRTVVFDSLGNLFVADTGTNRIQKFHFWRNSCTSALFFSSNCPNQMVIGTYCNISSTACSILNPCENQGSCTYTTSTISGYICQCRLGFGGNRCQYDHRPCKPNTCWNNGTCYETSSTTYECRCRPGWMGENCGQMVNYCETTTCENKGVCRPILMNYTCECLGESFSGRHCETVASSLVVRKTVSVSVAYVAIIFIISTVAFIVTMDILKYCFRIDVAKCKEKQSRKCQRKKRGTKCRPVMHRFVYVIDTSHLNQLNAAIVTSNVNNSVNSEETRV